MEPTKDTNTKPVRRRIGRQVRTLGLAMAALVSALLAFGATPAHAAYPYGGPYNVTKTANGTIEAWVNWETTCGAPTGLRCHTYQKIESTTSGHVAGRWMSGAAGWNVIRGGQATRAPMVFPYWGSCQAYRQVVEHYTEFWGPGGTFNVSLTWKVVGAGYTSGPGMKVTTAKQTWTSSWVTICPGVVA